MKTSLVLVLGVLAAGCAETTSSRDLASPVDPTFASHAQTVTATRGRPATVATRAGTTFGTSSAADVTDRATGVTGGGGTGSPIPGHHGDPRDGTAAPSDPDTTPHRPPAPRGIPRDATAAPGDDTPPIVRKGLPPPHGEPIDERATGATGGGNSPYPIPGHHGSPIDAGRIPHDKTRDLSGPSNPTPGDPPHGGPIPRGDNAAPSDDQVQIPKHGVGGPPHGIPRDATAAREMGGPAGTGPGGGVGPRGMPRERDVRAHH